MSNTSLKKDITDNKVKKSISKHTRSLMKSMTKKYSPKKNSVKRMSETHKFVQKRIESNQLKIQQFQQSRKEKTLGSTIFNLGTNAQLMDAVLFLVKTTICVVLLPFIVYLKNQPDKLFNYNQLYKFFVEQHSKTITKILSQSITDHPAAIVFLTEKLVYNPLGKILMKFSLFKGIVNAINHIKIKKEVLERKMMEVFGRCLFNYDTFYAFKQALESFAPLKKDMTTIEKYKYISRSSGTMLTLFDLVLCGTKSSWCQSLEPVQKITYVFPIFIDLGTIMYDVVEGSKHKGDLKDPLDIVALGFQHYCKKTFKLEDNLYTDYKVLSIEELNKSFITLDYQGPKNNKEEYEAKFKLYQLMSDPERLVEMARHNPEFKEEFKKLKLQSNKSLMKGDRNNHQKIVSDMEKEVDVLMKDLRNLKKATNYCQWYRNNFKTEQDFLKKTLNKKSDELLLSPITGLKISKWRFRYKPYTKIAVLSYIYQGLYWGNHHLEKLPAVLKSDASTPFKIKEITHIFQIINHRFTKS